MSWLRKDRENFAADARSRREIIRITPQLGLPPIKAAPVKPRRIDGKVARRALEGHISRDDMAHWPRSLRPAGFYNREGRIHVPI